MIIPLCADAVGILFMRTAFEQVPYELEEAALIDGAGVVRRFATVVLPLVRPALITVTILSFQASWNEFTHFLVATSDPDLATINLGIAQLTAGDLRGPSQFPLKLALATLATIPVARGLRDLPALLRPRDRRGRGQGLTRLGRPGEVLRPGPLRPADGRPGHHPADQEEGGDDQPAGQPEPGRSAR